MIPTLKNPVQVLCYSCILISCVLGLNSCKEEEDQLAVDLAAIKSRAETYNNFYSAIISKDNEIIFEEYFNGQSAETLFDGRSVAKGTTSLLVGKAIELGYFSLDTRLGDFLPEVYADGLEQEKLDITVEQFLTMSSGLGGLESEFGQWIKVPDEIVVVLERDLVSEPGEVLNYSTPNVQLLSVIFQEATGQSLLEFGQEHFFTPMGMGEVNWVGFETGYTLCGSLIFMRTLDYLKLGEMVLNNGVYKGTRIMEPGYLEAMIQPQFTFGPNGANSPKITSSWFGYLWWEIDVAGVDGFMTAGYGGQFIAVFPALQLVVAVNSKAAVNFAEAVPQNQNATEFIADVVIAVKKSTP